MNQRRSLNIQALALMVGTGIAQILVAVLYILTARAMRPSDYGLVVSAIALGVVGGGFLDFGANLYWVRELASKRMSHSDFLVRASIRTLIVLAVGTAIVIPTAFLEPAFIATGILLVTTNTVQTVLVPLRADQRAESVGWLVVLGRSVAIVAFLVQTGVGTSPASALWMSLAVGDCVLIASAYRVTPVHARPSFRVACVNPWAGAKWFSAVTLSNNAGQLDLPIMAAVADPTAAGIYAGVNRWIQPINVAIGAFASAAAPLMAAEHRLAALIRSIRGAIWILCIGIGLCAVIAITAPWLVPLLLGSDFSDAVPVLQLLALAMLFNAVGQPVIVALQVRKFDHFAAVIVAVSVSVHLVLVVSLCPSLGALGAGIGAVAAQLVLLIGALGGLTVIIRRWRGNSN